VAGKIEIVVTFHSSLGFRIFFRTSMFNVQHPMFKISSPGDFIPRADSYGACSCRMDLCWVIACQVNVTFAVLWISVPMILVSEGSGDAACYDKTGTSACLLHCLELNIWPLGLQCSTFNGQYCKHKICKEYCFHWNIENHRIDLANCLYSHDHLTKLGEIPPGAQSFYTEKAHSRHSQCLHFSPS